METYIPVIIFGGIMLVFIVLFLVALVYLFRGKGPSERFKEIAENWNFSYEKEAGMEIYADFDHPLLSEPKSSLQRARYVMRGEKYGLKWEISSYSYHVRGASIGTGRGSPIGSNGFRYEMMFAIEKKTAPFVLERAGLLDKINPFQKDSDVEFPEDQEFTKYFKVSSKDPAKAKEIFNKEVREFLEIENVDYTIVSNGSRMLFFKEYKVVPYEKLEEVMEEIAQIAKKLN